MVTHPSGGASLTWEEDPNLPQLPAYSSSSPDYVVAGSSTTALVDDFRFHQELLKRVASNLGLEIELNEPAYKLFGSW